MTRIGALAALALAAAPAVAQQPPAILSPGAIQQRQIDEDRRRQQFEQEQRKQSTEPLIKRDQDAAPRAPAPGADAVRFMVREIRFTPSEILKPEELEAIAKEFRGRELTVNDLKGIAERVNALYKAKGVVTAQAVVPPQDVSSGVVQIRLIEGRVGKFDVQGNATTREGYVTSRLGLHPADLVDLERLEQSMVRYNRTNDTQLKAELKPGSELGTTDLYLTLTEPPLHDLRLTVDNSGSPSTGLWREGLSYENRSLIGYRDELTASASHSTGHDGYSLGYSVPFNIWGGRLSYGYYNDSTAVKHGPLQTLNITGKSTANIAGLRQPLLVGEKYEFDLLAGAKQRTTTNWIDAVFLNSTKTSDSSAGGDLQLSGAAGYLFGNFTRTWLGADVEGGTAPVHANYRIDRATLRYSKDLPGSFTLRANYGWQGSPQQLLPSSEQFFLGGEGSVRGYYVGTFAGDHGYTMGVELHHPLYQGSAAEGWDIQASGFLFADYGKTYPFRPPNTAQRAFERLSSVGAGVNAAFGKHVYGRATLAYALDDAPQQPRNWTLLFQLVASAF